MTNEHEHLAENGWRRFWNRGGWWKALALAIVYLALYEGFGLLLGPLVGHLINADVLADPQSVLLAFALPVFFGAIVLLIFIWSLRWFREIFGPQSLKGSWWMWIAVGVLIVPIVLRVVATDWSAYSPGVVLSTLLAGLGIGLAEELLTRGLAVDLLRRAGHGERVVAILSSLIFALLHAANALTGQPIVTVLLTVGYTFGFGLMMYLVLRVTGSIVWPILLHAATDPTSILATGGLDTHGDTAGSDGLLGIAGVFNILYIVLGLVAIIFIKGKAYPDRRSLRD